MKFSTATWFWTIGAFIAVLLVEVWTFSYRSPAFALFTLGVVIALIGLRDIMERRIDLPMLGVAAAFVASSPFYALGIVPLQ